MSRSGTGYGCIGSGRSTGSGGILLFINNNHIMWIIRKEKLYGYCQNSEGKTSEERELGWVVKVNPIAAAVAVVLCIAAIVGLYV